MRFGFKITFLRIRGVFPVIWEPWLLMLYTKQDEYVPLYSLDQSFTHCVNIYIHGSEELELIEKVYEKYDDFQKPFSDTKIFSMCIKYVVLNSSYLYELEITREVSRYAEISSVVLLPAMPRDYPYKSFGRKYIEDVVNEVFDESFRHSIHCIFLIVDNDNTTATTEVQQYPANMVLMKLKNRKTADGRLIVVHYLKTLCHNYCSQYWTDGHKFGDLVPANKFHKRHLYSANLGSISFALSPSTSTIPNDLLSYCQKFVANLISKNCDSKVMSMASFAELHNFTVAIYNLKVKSNRVAFDKFTDSYIVYPTLLFFISSRNVPFHVIYSHDASMVIFYCSKESREENRSKIFHWIEPFTALLWLYCFMLLGIPFLITFISTNSASDSLGSIYGVVGVILRQYTGVVGRKLLIFTSFFGLIVGSFYESQITSLAIVQLPPETIQSLQQLLQRGYKILLKHEEYHGTYKEDFKMREILDKFNDSWFRYASVYDGHDKKFALEVSLLAVSNGRQKYAAMEAASDTYFSLLKHTQSIREETACAECNCHPIPDEIARRHHHWIVNVKNVYWLVKSLHHVKEAGFQNVWNHWAKWVEELNYIMYERRLQEKGSWVGDSFFHEKNLGPALIKLEEIGGFLLLSLCPYITGIVILVVEISSKTANCILNGNAIRTLIEFKVYRSMWRYPTIKKVWGMKR
ncbi:unnamed protein product [Orchesella dallaii]|uniref:Uncharacterized protein n=1 Tax=Orchesella dallaii TaxID=48710 RepID=A0ABP1QFY7_9HEXA